MALAAVMVVASVAMTASPGSASITAPKVTPKVVHVVTHPTVVHHLVNPEVMVKWQRVALCEEGGNWHVIGPRFSGGLGISNANWHIFGGDQFAHNAAFATPEEQVVVAMRIQREPPDQYGCSGAW